MTYTRIYDALIQRYWTIPMSWEFAKAQLIAESDLDPEAVSPAGAQGLAQLMPETFSDMATQLNFPSTATPFMPTYAIPAYARYMQQVFDKWTMPRPMLDRFQLTLASYNAGLGNIVRAQQWAQMAPDYLSIIAKLDAVTGIKNAEQTRGYVTRIGAIYLDLTSANIDLHPAATP